MHEFSVFTASNSESSCNPEIVAVQEEGVKRIIEKMWDKRFQS